MEFEVAALKPGEMIGPYRIVRKIGQGGMGEVYEAFEETLQRRIAIKILTHEASGRPDLVRRFQVEGRALARLEHGNIVRVYTLDEHNGQVYMAMEYIDGWTLDEYLRKHYFGLHEIMRLARHLLEGLAAAHSAGIVHRDIKPQNIMVDRQLQTKLLDFGIAKLNEDNGGVNTRTGVMLGTLNYIAPEIFNGGSATKQSDIYSLGLVLYLMFSGKSPFTGRNRLEIVEKVANTRITFSPESNAILPMALKKVIYRMIAKEVDDRYTSARDALMDLERVNLNSLPADLRPALSSHLNIECSDELRMKCVQIGLEYFEIRLVMCLAAEITLKGQRWAGQENIVIGPQALTEAARRYVFAKRQMIVRNAYMNSSFRWAVVGLGTAIAFTTFTVVSVLKADRVKANVTVAPPPPPPPAAPATPAPATAPIANAATPATATPPPDVKPAPPTQAEKPVESAPNDAAPKIEAITPAPKPEEKEEAAVTPPPEPPAVPKVKTATKSASAHKVAKKSKAAKGKNARAPASIKKPEVSPSPLPTPAAMEPDFLQQKPVLLPTVIERRGRGGSQ